MSQAALTVIDQEPVRILRSIPIDELEGPGLDDFFVNRDQQQKRVEYSAEYEYFDE